jgi:hypothetical protein
MILLLLSYVNFHSSFSEILPTSQNRIGGVMVSVLIPVDRGFEPELGQSQRLLN